MRENNIAILWMNNIMNDKNICKMVVQVVGLCNVGEKENFKSSFKGWNYLLISKANPVTLTAIKLLKNLNFNCANS